MTDVILIATIVVFFFATALLVRALGAVIAGSGDGADPEEAASEKELERRRPG